MGDSGDEDRDAILKRRQTFAAVALASMSTIGCDEVTPRACLDVPPEIETREAPQVCLAQQIEMHPIPAEETTMESPEENEPIEDEEETAMEAPEREAQPATMMQNRPRPCLSVRRVPPPTACLNVVYDPNDL